MGMQTPISLMRKNNLSKIKLVQKNFVLQNAPSPIAHKPATRLAIRLL